MGKILANKALNSIFDKGINKSFSPTSLLGTDIMASNPVGFVTAGGYQSGLLSQLGAIGRTNSGQQSYGTLFNKLPKVYGF